jgi:hypothetical protein
MSFFVVGASIGMILSPALFGLQGVKKKSFYFAAEASVVAIL